MAGRAASRAIARSGARECRSHRQAPRPQQGAPAAPDRLAPLRSVRWLETRRPTRLIAGNSVATRARQSTPGNFVARAWAARAGAFRGHRRSSRLIAPLSAEKISGCGYLRIMLFLDSVIAGQR